VEFIVNHNNSVKKKPKWITSAFRQRFSEVQKTNRSLFQWCDEGEKETLFINSDVSVISIIAHPAGVGYKSTLINKPGKGDRKFYTVRSLIIFPLPFQGVGFKSRRNALRLDLNPPRWGGQFNKKS
jgi:hypothetical protein